MLNKPTIPYIFVDEMLAGCLRRGLDKTELYRHCELQRPDNIEQQRISVEDYSRLFIQAQSLIDDEMLGLFAKPVPVGSYAVLCRLLIRCDNLAQVLEHLNDYFALFNRGKPVWQLERREENNCAYARIQLASPDEFQASQPFYAHLMLLSLHKLMCALSQQKIQLNTMGFAFARKHYAANLAYLFDCPQQFAQRYSFIECDDALLQQPLPRDKSLEQSLAQASPQQYLAYLLTWQVNDSLEAQVYRLLAASLNAGEPLADLTYMAEQLGLSAATLSRRLQQLGLSYQRIKEAVRRDLALELLLRQRLSLQQVSARLGFSEVSAFSRAFKQWMGVSPAQYVKRNG